MSDPTEPLASVVPPAAQCDPAEAVAASSAPGAPPAPRPRPVTVAVNEHPSVVAAHRRGSLTMSAPGFLGALLAPVYLWRFGIAVPDVVLFVVMYWLTQGVGLSVGFHRHFTHGSFRAPRGVRWLLAVLGSMGSQGSLVYWVSVHRRHHALSDRPGDPHSPRPEFVQGRFAALRSFWNGYYGWSLTSGLPNAMHYCPDLLREPYLMKVSRDYKRWVVAGLVIPALVGGLWTGTALGALGGFFWGGLFRLFVSLQMTGVLNSVGHRFGKRPFDTGDLSTNNGWWAIPLMGELWHNNHHAYPTSAAHGFGWRQLDLNYLVIVALEKLGLASKVKRPPAEALARVLGTANEGAGSR